MCPLSGLIEIISEGNTITLHSPLSTFNSALAPLNNPLPFYLSILYSEMGKFASETWGVHKFGLILNKSFTQNLKFRV